MTNFEEVLCCELQKDHRTPKKETMVKIKKRTPKEILHEYCHDCIRKYGRDDQLVTEVKNCGGDLVLATGRSCPFYPYRLGNRRPPMKVLRQFCLECMGGSAQFVRECKSTNCPLHLYRFGKNPARRGADAARMAQIRCLETMFSTVKTIQDQFL